MSGLIFKALLLLRVSYQAQDILLVYENDKFFSKVKDSKQQIIHNVIFALSSLLKFRNNFIYHHTFLP